MDSPDNSALPIVNFPWHDWDDIKRIYLDYLGCVPEPVLRDFVRAATGEEQPDRGPVTVLSPGDLEFLYGSDPRTGDLVFVALRDAIRDAPLAAAASLAGTWGRFLDAGAHLARALRDTLTREATYRSFGCFRHVKEEEGDSRSRYELLREYGALDWRVDRPPRPGDRVTLQDLYELSARDRLRFRNPVGDRREDMPWYIRNAYERRTLDIYRREISGPRYVAEDEEAIVADMDRLGFVLIRDQLVIDCFLGRAANFQRVQEHLKSYEKIDRELLRIRT